MKHTPSITLLMLALFLAAQLMGLLVVSRYLQVETFIDPLTNESEERIIGEDLPFAVERPDIDESVPVLFMVGFVLVAIILGTILLLILIRFGQMNLWKIWYLLAVVVTLTVAFSGFVSQYVAAAIAVILGLLKVFRPTPLFQNLTEIFIYGGLAAIIVPINRMTMLPIILLLIAISIYDIIAVNHTKHMVKMANFQTQSKLFAGLLVPYQKQGKIVHRAIEPDSPGQKGEKIRIAVLGGGDIGFPLLFAGVAMKSFIASSGIWVSILKVLPIPLFATLMLALLFSIGKKDRFYPAMPFISIGCLLGYGLLVLLF